MSEDMASAGATVAEEIVLEAEVVEAATPEKKKKAKTARKKKGENFENRQFQAETRQLLNLMVHSLYTHKEIFLRELISNASDALDKIRFRSLTDETLMDKDDALEIWLAIDKDRKTFTISDNGIGMSRQEVIDNIGTIARSGSKAFINALQENKKGDLNSKAQVDLIGQFGVGFYSSFMVAERVELITRGAYETQGVRWESDGEGEYTLEDIKVPKRGTTITLFLREEVLNPSDPAEDYLNQYTIQNMVKKYSDFINYPIKINFEKENYQTDEEGKPKKTEKEIEVRTLNKQLPLWERNKADVTEDEYFQFFKHHFHDWNEPADILHSKVEGSSIQYTALLFIPSQAATNLYAADYKKGLQLYAKHVFVKDRCEELLPDHLRFVKGLVDSPDFSLNISREILQHDAQLKVISKNLEKKVMDALKKMLSNEREKYEKWWGEFGKAIKGGIYMHYSNKEKLQDLLLFPSSHSETGMTTLREYVSRMPEWQKEIYYEVGKDRAAIERLPQMEVVREKGVEVLYFFDKVDEFLTQNLYDYDEKKLKSVSRGDFTLDGEKKEDEKKDEKKEEKEVSPYQPLLDKVKAHLGERVREVRISKRLKSSPVCLVSSDTGVSFNMEMLLKEANQTMGKAARILELNPEHATFKIMETAFTANQEADVVKDFAELFYEQALLIEGLPLENPVAFATRINKLMVAAHPQ